MLILKNTYWIIFVKQQSVNYTSYSTCLVPYVFSGLKCLAPYVLSCPSCLSCFRCLIPDTFSSISYLVAPASRASCVFDFLTYAVFFQPGLRLITKGSLLQSFFNFYGIQPSRIQQSRHALLRDYDIKPFTHSRYDRNITCLLNAAKNTIE